MARKAKVGEEESGGNRAARLQSQVEGGGSYFGAPKEHIEFIKSGSKLLDLALGGGWAEGRIANVVGDKAVGKTLIAIEASANFAAKHPKGRILYRECEAAFDPKYAEALGLPLGRVEFSGFESVEAFFKDLQEVVSKGGPALYILDSLDALSDRAELDRDLDQGTFGASKAKQLSQVFRRITAPMAAANETLMVVSQVRDAIGVTFGRKSTRSGGRALDFYASQVVYLSNLGKLKRTGSGVERAIGIEVRAQLDKNKVGLPFREAQFSIMFGYGIDDIQACLDWLAEAGGLELLGLSKEEVKHAKAGQSKFVKALTKLDDETFRQEVVRVHSAVEKRWWEVENSFLPKRRKYA